MFLLILGAASAAEIDNVTSTDDSTLIVNSLSSNNMEEPALKTADNSNYSDNVLTTNTTNNETAADNVSAANITKTDTSISVKNARYSQSHTVFKIILKDTAGNSVENKTVTFKINSKTYTSTTDSKGAAYITTNSLKRGTYTVTAKFKGDSNFTKSSFSGKVSVYSSVANRINMVKTYGVDKNYTAIFWKDNGKLANTNVKITLNGKKYTVKTDSKGLASIATKLNPGKYTIKMYNPYSKETVSNTIKVNKDSSKITGSNAYILPKVKYSYSVTLSSGHNGKLKNGKIYFKYNGKQVTSTTDKNGKATITIPALSKGTYTITYQFKGNSKYKSVSASKKLYVKDSTTKLTASDLKMQYNDGSVFSVKVTSSGKVLANKTVKITLNGKTSTVTTDDKGVAKLEIGNLKPNTYTIKCVYSKGGQKDYTYKTNKIIVSKQKINISADDLKIKHGDNGIFEVNVKNKTGSALSSVQVQFTLNSKTTKIKTDSNGAAKLNVNENVGYYPVTVQLADNALYTSSKVTKHILVNGTKFEAKDLTAVLNTNATFSVKLVDGQEKAVSGTVKFTLNNITTSVQTDASGIAKLRVSGLAKGVYTVTYTDGTVTGSSKISIVDKSTLKEIITASQNVKKYIENNEALPETVSIGGVTYTTAEYLYLASQAIINLKNNNKKDITAKQVNNPTSPKAAENLGNLYNYLAVAKSVVNTANSKGTMPNSVSSELGNIGYKGLVYATARVVAFYGDNSIMPNYVTIKKLSSSTSSSLNSKNTITNLKAYLAASTNCQVGNSKIKSIVSSVTSGLTTEKAKATAIYNYVRDYISYSFYYDTKYGAVGTLNAKTGNCVDQAHLLVAMYRTAGLAARYVHGTCVFSSGNTYGHVWTQVLVGNTWTVGDPTSSRNSFGNVVNWNNNNYNLKGYYASIAF